MQTGSHQAQGSGVKQFLRLLFWIILGCLKTCYILETPQRYVEFVDYSNIVPLISLSFNLSLYNLSCLLESTFHGLHFKTDMKVMLLHYNGTAYQMMDKASNVCYLQPTPIQCYMHAVKMHTYLASMQLSCIAKSFDIPRLSQLHLDGGSDGWPLLGYSLILYSTVDRFFNGLLPQSALKYFGRIHIYYVNPRKHLQHDLPRVLFKS